MFLNKNKTKKSNFILPKFMVSLHFVRAYPKVNIALKVHQKKGNLHPISSRFCLALGDLYDEMLFCFVPLSSHDLAQAPSIFLEQQTHNRPYQFCIIGNFDCGLESNLIYKAFLILHEVKIASQNKVLNHAKTMIQNSKNTKHILIVAVKKAIPFGGGLGGGSVNAAIALLMLNEILELYYPKEILLECAKKLGSDIAFFIEMYMQEYNVIHPYFRESYKSDGVIFKDILNIKELFSPTFRATLQKDIFCLDNIKTLKYYSANVFGFGDIVEKYIEEICYFNLHCNAISCNTAKVYAEFDRLQTLSQQNRDIKPQSNSLDFSLDSQTLLKQHALSELNDLYIPACNLYHELSILQHSLELQYQQIYFSGSGSSFFSLKSC